MSSCWRPLTANPGRSINLWELDGSPRETWKSRGAPLSLASAQVDDGAVVLAGGDGGILSARRLTGSGEIEALATSSRSVLPEERVHRSIIRVLSTLRRSSQARELGSARFSPRRSSAAIPPKH